MHEGVQVERVHLSGRTRRWLLAEVCPGGRVVMVRHLPGGISSSVHAVYLRDAHGEPRRVVLRQWTRTAGGDTNPSITNEQAVLASLASTSVPAPRVLAASDDVDGHPSLVMSYVPGRMDLAPRDPDSWIRQIAAMLPVIHDAPVVGQRHRPSRRVIDSGVPPWSGRPDLWKEVGRVLTGPAPTAECFIHADYQHFNLLWDRGRLNAVVDWTMSGVGAPDRDVGHCRLNLAVLYSVEMAEQFRLAYQAEAGRQLEQWWDVHELACYSDQWPTFIPLQVAGRIPIDLAGMQERVEALLAIALR